jgi:hypothetical protein
MKQNDKSTYIHTNIKSIYTLQRLNISIDSHMCNYFLNAKNYLTLVVLKLDGLKSLPFCNHTRSTTFLIWLKFNNIFSYFFDIFIFSYKKFYTSLLLSFTFMFTRCILISL